MGLCRSRSPSLLPNESWTRSSKRYCIWSMSRNPECWRETEGSMRVLRLGIDHATGKLLYPALEEQVLAQALRQGVARNLARLRSESEAVSQAVAFRGEVQPQPTVNLADPRAAGWTYLVAEDDPRRSEIASIMKPLALYRGMDDC